MSNNQKDFFESIYEFKSDEKFIQENLFEADDDDDAMGNIIDRGLSFVPRAMRFRKAKKVMKKALRGYLSKSNSLIRKFDNSMSALSNKVDNKYNNFVETKIQPLVDDGKTEQAIALLESFAKELESVKSSKLQELNKSIESILDAYTNAIEKRIESPGFVFNVELSEKGKGELTAKWKELVAKQKLKIDQKIANLIDSKGLSRIDEIISEVNHFIEEKKYSSGKSALDYYVKTAKPISKTDYMVDTHLRTSGRRYVLSEKGLLWDRDPNKLDLKNKGINMFKSPDTTYAPFKANINVEDPESYVRPYLMIKGNPTPKYGKTVRLLDVLNNTAEAGQAETGDDDDLSSEEKINKN